MKEIEVKIINSNMKSFRKRIIELGAKNIFKGKILSITLDYTDGCIKRKDSLLRLRSFGNDKCELTFKGPKETSQYKIREEINLELKNFNDTMTLLKSIGLNVTSKIYKFRESYLLEIKNGRKVSKYHIDIDKYKIMPEFAEIEAKNIKELICLIHLLKIPKDKIYNGSTQDIIKLYGIR